MKVIVAGSRTVSNFSFVEKAIELAIQQKNWNISEIVSGMAKGVDTYAVRWGFENNVPIKKMPADWNQHGKSAGPIRNKQMAEYADACIVLYDGQSKGSSNMIKQAQSMGLDTAIFLIDEIEKILIKESKIENKKEDYVLNFEREKDLQMDKKIARLEHRIEDLESEIKRLNGLIDS